ncbi:putative mitochondrial-processing peptidase subunit beta [Hibiscus syriacus]|uniref:Mitochondrial-processing peptidase subunit beta n=1 Tax=Hibiscus syriacus TaxID=106335 RepID=A0A6A2ZCE9_HIBSY|nr:putative mitochondrial-processing peptidase subunit beta [Hibiscus syriacus]
MPVPQIRFTSSDPSIPHAHPVFTRNQNYYFAQRPSCRQPNLLCLPARPPLASGSMQNSKFDEHRISRERDVILREMEEVEGQRRSYFDHLHSTAFQYTPLGRTILGPVDNIRTITKGDLEKYTDTLHCSEWYVIAASGAVKHEEVVEQVKKLFTKLSSDPTTASQLVVNEPAAFTGSEVRIINDDVPLAQFAVAFEGASWTDPDSIALMVMQAMLGSCSKNVGGGKHMGSDLAQKVGINEIAECMMVFNTKYKDTGLFGVYAVPSLIVWNDLAYAIMYEITKLTVFQMLMSFMLVIRAVNETRQIASYSRLTRSKLHKYSDRMDSTRARLEFLTSRNELLNIRLEKLLKSSLMLHIDGTSPVAEDIGHQDIAIAAMDPIQGLPDYNWFRRRTYWNRY